ncbi:helix-turn-helix domain-containing protein [Pinibacter aurantiacus]|uniref:Helix-turn-helix domain-containing protein n=1 Tax=Pinibacter aurantiacus TaxID=2851599 RepID=A0A9E2W7I2_9BACT|nr:helix-turn-helix transcriptional regulator [Pinibacter aurantiacus]MBV4356327.1 helix-turn-helix domain-containing protein [Pinibacter aurantiacus]
MSENKKTKIEQYVINKIKEIRIAKGFSQEDIAAALDTSRGFIGQVESLNHSSKYNLNHLNLLAIELGVSIKDFFPEKPITETKKKNVKN